MDSLTCSSSELQQLSLTPALLALRRVEMLTPIMRTWVLMKDLQGLYKGVMCTREA